MAVAERQQGDRAAAMAAAERRWQPGNGGGSIGSAVAASTEWRRQCGSEATTAGSAAMASAAQDGSGRDKDC